MFVFDSVSPLLHDFRRFPYCTNAAFGFEKDTVFIGSGQIGGKGGSAKAYYVSHRGGEPGFIKVRNSAELQIPDYPGNNFFNTIGNIICDARIALLFIDLETGELLHITGTANIDWKPDNPHDPGALRMINICVDAVIDRPNAFSLRWEKQPSRALSLKLSARHIESEDITSFYFTSADGRSLEPFKPGQHLPIEVQIPGQPSLSKRSYSLSG